MKFIPYGKLSKKKKREADRAAAEEALSIL